LSINPKFVKWYHWYASYYAESGVERQCDQAATFSHGMTFLGLHPCNPMQLH